MSNQEGGDCEFDMRNRLVLGGQGKSAQEVKESTYWFVACVVSMAVLFGVAVAGVLLG